MALHLVTGGSGFLGNLGRAQRVRIRPSARVAHSSHVIDVYAQSFHTASPRCVVIVSISILDVEFKTRTAHSGCRTDALIPAGLAYPGQLRRLIDHPGKEGHRPPHRR